MILPQLSLLLLCMLTAGVILFLRRSHHTLSSPAKDHEAADTLTPSQLAYLKGGTEGLTRATLLQLERKGWLTTREEHRATGAITHFAPAHAPPPPSLLRAAELELWLVLASDPTPRSMSTLLAGPLSESLELFAAQHHRDLATKGLMHSPSRCAAHDASRTTLAWVVVSIGTLFGLIFLLSSVAGAVFMFGSTWIAWRLVHALGTHPRRTSTGDMILEVYEDLYAPMYTRRDTWRRFTPKDFDYMRVIFSSP